MVKIFFSLLLSMTICQLYAQPDPRLEGWAGAALGIKWNKYWDTKISTQWRSQYKIEDEEFRNRAFLQVEGIYDPKFSPFFKDVRMALGLRLLSTDATTTRHLFRFHIDLMKNISHKRWEFGYRLRFQMRDDFRAKEDVYQNYWTKDLRNLIQVKYNFKKWKLDPTIWAEVFLHDELGALSGLTHYRVGIKTRYKFDNHHSLSFRYFLERETRYYNPKIIHTFAVQYRYQFKVKKRSKKN